MFYAVNKGDKLGIYRATSPPKVTVEKLEIPAKELSPSSRWRNVTARLVKVTVKGGTEVTNIPTHSAFLYCGTYPADVGGVSEIPKDYHPYIRSLIPRRRRT